MIIRKAFKFRLKTNEKQAQILSHYVGCCRFVWNKMLAIQKDRLNNNEKILRYNDSSKYLPIWKNDPELRWLRDAPAAALQQKLRDLDRALMDAFDKKQPLKRFPRFRKRGLGDSFRVPQPKAFSINGNIIKLPKIGELRFFKSQDIIGSPKQVTITRNGEHWYISVQVEIDLNITEHPNKNVIGLDMGVSKLFTLSNGEVIKPINSLKSLEKKLATAQRKLSRMVKFSNGWKKQNKRVNKIHTKIANIRKDYTHKATSNLSQRFETIVIEDLSVLNMTASAKGNTDKPGKNVKAKSGVNKAILDQGWGEAKRQLEYKLNWRGGQLVKVDPKYTSQTCNKCGYKDKNNRLSQSIFKCKSCGYTKNADVNAAMNILSRGHMNSTLEKLG